MHTNLGKRLTRARVHARMKQKDVAEYFGISSQAISQWEAERTRPDSQRLTSLARLFHVRLEWLLDESGPMVSEGSPPSAEVRHTTRVPVIDRVQAGDWTEVEDPFAVGSADEFLQTAPWSGGPIHFLGLQLITLNDEIVWTEEEMENLYKRTEPFQHGESKMFGMSYEEGIIATLEWILDGNIDPMGEEE